MNLPRKNKEGQSYISYSQCKSWNEIKGFNTGKNGKYEAMMTYFFGEYFADANGFAQFGIDVEDYICGKEEAKALFTDKEKEVLDKITPLGLFQKEIKLDFPEHGFYLKGFIDDATPDLKKIRDYKSASQKSKAKYYEPEYSQLDVYGLAVEQETGVFPELELCVIERLGNGFRGGRGVMNVGEEIWYITRETNKERLKTITDEIVSTAKEIEKYYEIFLKLNQI